MFVLVGLTWFLPALAQDTETFETPTLLYYTERSDELYGSMYEDEIAIRKDLLIPALEKSLGQNGPSKVNSIKVRGTSYHSLILAMNVNINGNNYDLACTLTLETNYPDSKVRLKIDDCPENMSSPLLHIEAELNGEDNGDGFMIVMWNKTYNCQNNIFVKENNCREWEYSSKSEVIKFQVPYTAVTEADNADF